MIVTCTKCSLQIQVDETKAPQRPFTIRCPKCNTTVNSGNESPASEKSGVAVGKSPSTDQHRFERREPAPLFKLDGVEEETSVAPAEEMTRLLANLLSQNGLSKALSSPGLPGGPRKALICLAEQHRETIARQLASNGYQVFVAQNTGQAIDRMRENQLVVVLLDHEFDSAEQGAAFVVREVNILRPPQRRRLFFVLLSPGLRTMDAHAAFLHNVNAIVNFREIADLPAILEQGLREYNELYKEMNVALNLAAL